jgi:phospho-N-acetylmuramoyl-pentapeptide-transferase
MITMARILAVTLVAMVIALFGGPPFIRWLRRRGIGQNIRDLTPEAHSAKQGTPTMGGVIILAAASIAYLAFSRRTASGLIVLMLVLGSGMIGFADDFLKQRRKRSLGLTGRNKLLLQLPLALLAVILLMKVGHVHTPLIVPFVSDRVNLSIGYYVFAVILIAGFSNGVNLTDGLDGLAGGSIGVCMFAYAGIAFMQKEYDLAILATALTGACVGFLWYNTFPAEIFMGDTGALALGAGLAGLAVATGTELLLFVIGGVFLAEALSVMIQVISFRYFKRRVFLMAPIHHHFELKNWSETKIIVRFWIAAAILAGAGFTLFFVDSTRFLHL